jgi:hypothetical protein
VSVSRRRQRRAVKGRQSTPSSPTVEELTGVAIDRQQAFDAGHLGALFDEVTAARRAAMEAAPREDLKDTDPVSLPSWAFEAVADLVENDVITGSKKRGRNALWWRQYRVDLLQWHRYALVRQRLTDGSAGWPDNAADLPGVFVVVSRELEGTAFAARPSTVKQSYEQVAAELAKGHHARYYRSTALHVYDFLLSTRDDARRRGVGPTYGHVYIKASH